MPLHNHTDALPVAAIVLAAGSSRRFGEQNKLLADLSGKPLLQHCLQLVAQGDFERRLLVLGHQQAALQEQMMPALEGCGVEFIYNRAHRQGMASSLAAAIAELGAEVSGAMILLADMPRLQPGHIHSLLTAFRDSGGSSIVAPFCGERRGNPVIWPRDLFPALQSLTGDVGGRQLLTQYVERLLPVAINSEAILQDVDSFDDLSRLRADIDVIEGDL